MLEVSDMCSIPFLKEKEEKEKIIKKKEKWFQLTVI